MSRKKAPSARTVRAPRGAARGGARSGREPPPLGSENSSGREVPPQGLELLLRNRRAETVGQLAGGVAHNLNNLLTVVIGTLDILAIELPADSPLRESCTAAQDAALKAAEVARRLLLYSLARPSGEEDADPAALVSRALELLRQGLPRNVEVDARIAPGLPCVRGDASRLEAALLDLAVNARNAMPSGGGIFFDAEALVVDGVAASALHGLPAGPYVRIVVRDTGRGMDEATAARAFEPFFTTRSTEGAVGLGLAAARDAVHSGGGRLTVRSSPAGGCVFTMLLPVAPRVDSAGPEQPVVPREIDRGCGETVLVVDDDLEVLRVTERMLAAIGYRVLAADSGPAALEVIARGDPSVHLVLIDVVMPGMGGLATLRRVRELRPGLPALLMTGYAGRDFVPPVDLGAELVPKPLSLSDLSAAVRRALGGSNDRTG